MLFRLKTLFHTLIHLKPIQVIYQVKNRVLKVGPLSSFQLHLIPTRELAFFEAPAIHQFLRIESDNYHFEFLNLSRSYSKDSIDWNEQSHGKLWNYNLQYLDFLKQSDISHEVKVDLVRDIYSWLWEGKLRLEPYPASLRIMNLIRFLNITEIDQISKEELTNYLLAEVNYLSRNLEYHLLANHLLENAFAFWMGALFFKHSRWTEKASNLLISQLNEQILSDGAHYELTPMYHQIILFRMLEAFNLTPDSYDLKRILREKLESMISWMGEMTFQNGSLPHFNDTTEGIAYSTFKILEIANSISIKERKIPLADSGYRSMEIQDLKLIADLEGIKPSYQPGHSHADTFSFLLNKGLLPVIVDPGISTYSIGKRRDWERSTIAHNTVTIDGKNSSSVWAGFRVAKRANVILVKDSPNHIIAFHDGFGNQLHQREFKNLPDGILIRDEIQNFKPTSLVEARFYFHPSIKPELVSAARYKLLDDLFIEFDNANEIKLVYYDLALGYNKLLPALSLIVSFKSNNLVTRIRKK